MSLTNASAVWDFRNFRATMTEKFSLERAVIPFSQSERTVKWTPVREESQIRLSIDFGSGESIRTRCFAISSAG